MLALVNQPSPAEKGDHTKVWWMRRSPFAQHSTQTYPFFKQKLGKFSPVAKININSALCILHFAFSKTSERTNNHASF